MKVHITNIHGQRHDSPAMKAQNRTADIAREKLNFNELGIYCYDVNSDSSEMLYSRVDGIIASVKFGDIVIYQYPTWNDFKFDKALISHLNNYHGLKKVFFIHDELSLMFESNRYILGEHIDFFNQADLVILPSQRMEDFLRAEGLKVQKTVIQKIWDFPVVIDQTVRPAFRKVVNFAGNPDSWKWAFAKEWNYNSVELKVTADKGDWAQGKNVSFLGWFADDISLLTTFRKNGGFGLVWSGDPYFCEYMKLNANYKFSAYLAAGIPVIVNKSIAESDTVVRKNLGLAVDSLDEAVRIIENMSENEYNKMVSDVAVFSSLIREGYFTQKCLTDAVFKLLYD